MGVNRPAPPRTRPALVGRQTGDARQDPAILALQEAVRRVEGREEFELGVVHLIQFDGEAPVTAERGSIYVDPIDGEAYYIDLAGVASQLSNQGGGGGDTYGDRQVVISLKDVSVPLGSVGAPGDGFTSIATTANNTTLVFGPLSVRLGERPKGCVARVNKNSTGLMTLRWQKSTDGGGRVDIGTSATSTTSGLQTLTSTVAVPTTTIANENYYVTITCPNSGDQVFWVTSTVDKVT